MEHQSAIKKKNLPYETMQMDPGVMMLSEIPYYLTYYMEPESKYKKQAHRYRGRSGN